MYKFNSVVLYLKLFGGLNTNLISSILFKYKPADQILVRKQMCSTQTFMKYLICYRCFVRFVGLECESRSSVVKMLINFIVMYYDKP